MKRSLALLAAATLFTLTAGAAPAAPIELSFADFFALPIGPRGLEPTPALRAADGQPVRLTGFMVRREQPQPGLFLLTPRPVTMSEHADGEADDLPASTVTVLLPPAQRDNLVGYRAGALTLTGRLQYGPAEDETGRVSWIRLQLDPQALEATPSDPAAAERLHAHSH